MQYYLRGTEVEVRWSIYKGPSNVKEDFSKSLLKLFLLGLDSKYVVCDFKILETGEISFLIPKDLPVGVYHVRALWVKNGSKSPTLGNLGRNILLSQHDNAFFVTGTSTDPVERNVVFLKSCVAIYGYDGLGAWELAVFRGLTTASEQEWICGIAEIYDIRQELHNLAEKLGLKRHMVITQSLDGILGYNDTEVVTARVEDGLGNDVTDEYYGWSCTRDSGDEVSDYVWNSVHVNCGNEILISRSDVRISDGRTYNTFTFTAHSEHGSLEGVLKLNQ